MIYHKLITRIETVSNDPRYAFMFENANVGGDTMAEAISQLFRLPADGKPMTIMQLAGFPAEVVDAVVSVLCRMAFDFGLWSDGATPAAVRLRGGAPLRRRRPHASASARPAGRSRASPRRAASTASSSALVTQRPAELDPTIISQCSTLFAMRMSNDRDQALLRSAVSDAAANLFAFVPSLGTREALAFGVGVPLPTRLTFAELPPHLLPKSETFANEPTLQASGQRPQFHRLGGRALARRDDEPRPRRRAGRRERPPAPRRPWRRLRRRCPPPGPAPEPSRLQPVEEAAGRPARSARGAARLPVRTAPRR